MAKRSPPPLKSEIRNQKLEISLTPDKFDNVHQIGGIRLGTLDLGGAGGGVGGPQSRVAFINTGSGFRFIVALDRGGDIIDASYNQHNLAYLSPNGLMPPNQAYHVGLDWLYGWPGGLVTTCGPQYAGGPRQEDGITTSLHGRYSNQVASIESVINPDPRRGKNGMSLTLITRDAHMFGPVLEIRRTIRCSLGRPELNLDDEVTNLGNQRAAHTWLYHVNFGYPLLDAGARIIYRGKADTYWQYPDAPAPMPSLKELDRLKNVLDPIPEHTGPGERGTILRIAADRNGLAHAGIINRTLGLGVEVEFPVKSMPRIANWQHYGPAGSYVVGIEPFFGSLMGKAKDPDPQAEQYLKPGQGRKYSMTVRIHHGAAGLRELAEYDGPVSR